MAEIPLNRWGLLQLIDHLTNIFFVFYFSIVLTTFSTDFVPITYRLVVKKQKRKKSYKEK